MSDSGTVDITNVVESLRSAFVDWATAFVMGEELLIPQLAWLATTPIVSSIDKAVIHAVIDSLSKSAVLGAFFLNSAIKNASQAHDFVTAVNVKQTLPPTASDLEVENAEKAQMHAFRNFVLFTN
jgi:hypothetical protein